MDIRNYFRSLNEPIGDSTLRDTPLKGVSRERKNLRRPQSARRDYYEVLMAGWYILQADGVRETDGGGLALQYEPIWAWDTAYDVWYLSDRPRIPQFLWRFFAYKREVRFAAGEWRSYKHVTVPLDRWTNTCYS